MSDQPIRLAVVIASTREGRRGGYVGAWFVDQARLRTDLEVSIIDLAEVSLPAFMSRAPHDGLAAVSAAVDAADAFVVVTPEYNHSYPASIKTLIDLTGREWHAKPIGFVSYGGLSGGVRAVEHLRQVFAEVHATTIRDAVAFPGVGDHFDEDGTPIGADRASHSTTIMLDRLVWWARALRVARLAVPYK